MALPSRVQMVHVRPRCPARMRVTTLGMISGAACPLAERSSSVAESVSLDFCIARPRLSMVDGLVQTTVEAHSAAAICVK